MRITVLVENSVNRRGLGAEHGLSVHFQLGRHAVLFDTGQTDLLLRNAAGLGVSLRDLAAIVLSHGHYDHCGGLAAVASLSPAAPICLHPAATAAKFSAGEAGAARHIGMSDEALPLLRGRAEVVWTNGLTEVVPGLFATGEIPRGTSYEDVGGRFFLDAACQQPDPLLDDQALFCETREGLVVMLGCAHAGVVNTLDHIQRLTGLRRIHAVLGGMHLLHASPDRMQQTLAALAERDIALLVPSHCTGWRAAARLVEQFPDRCLPGGVGAQFVFPR